MIEPVVRSELLIRAPVEKVFEAFIDPDITARFWFSRGTARLHPHDQAIEGRGPLQRRVSRSLPGHSTPPLLILPIHVAAEPLDNLVPRMGRERRHVIPQCRFEGLRLE